MEGVVMIKKIEIEGRMVPIKDIGNVTRIYHSKEDYFSYGVDVDYAYFDITKHKYNEIMKGVLRNDKFI
jgi:hypothetical protein